MSFDVLMFDLVAPLTSPLSLSYPPLWIGQHFEQGPNRALCPSRSPDPVTITLCVLSSRVFARSISHSLKHPGGTFRHRPVFVLSHPRSVQVQMDYHIRLARDEGVVATPSPSSSPDSTRSWSEQHFPPEERPGNGAQQATSVSPPPILQGSSPHLQSTPHCSMNPNPGGAGGAATSVTTCGKRNVRRHMPQHEPLATDPCVPVFVTTAASAAVGVGDPMVSRSTIAATGQEPVAESAPVVPTGHSALELGLPEGELGAWDGEVRLTDEDLLDAASVFLDEEGLQEHDTFP